ncbi:MAG: lipoyl domain-containing protein [Candidatus Omnitrophota bacterium]
MEFRLPEVTNREESVVITRWHVKKNARIEKDQDIVEISADKATFDIAAPAGGVLRKIIKTEGENARAGDILAEIE